MRRRTSRRTKEERSGRRSRRRSRRTSRVTILRIIRGTRWMTSTVIQVVFSL